MFLKIIKDNYHFLPILGPLKGDYLTHRKSMSGTGDALAKEAHQVLKEYNSLKSIKATLVDNTPANTGHKSGMVYELEKLLGFKIHMIGCGLHFNELGLRALIQKVDGKTKSGNKYSGEVGCFLDQDLTLLPVIDFDAVPSDIDAIDDKTLSDLSNDQNLLWRYMSAVSSGNLDARLAAKQIGPLCHARWLTTAIRILSLYCRTENPSQVLLLLVNYIMRIYGKYWFLYKRAPNFLSGPKILHNQIQDVLQVAKKFEHLNNENTKLNIKQILFAVIQRNAFCCHFDNFLDSMLFSEEQVYRNQAVDIILKIRSGQHRNLQESKVPTINFDAESWIEMIDLEECALKSHSPACVRDLTEEDLKELIIVYSSQHSPEYPIHSQTVERSVKLTTNASQRAYSWKQQHSLIVSTIKSRNLRKIFNTKRGEYF